MTEVEGFLNSPLRTTAIWPLAFYYTVGHKWQQKRKIIALLAAAERAEKSIFYTEYPF